MWETTSRYLGWFQPAFSLEHAGAGIAGEAFFFQPGRGRFPVGEAPVHFTGAFP